MIFLIPRTVLKGLISEYHYHSQRICSNHNVSPATSTPSLQETSEKLCKLFGSESHTTQFGPVLMVLSLNNTSTDSTTGLRQVDGTFHHWSVAAACLSTKGKKYDHIFLNSCNSVSLTSVIIYPSIRAFTHLTMLHRDLGGQTAGDLDWSAVSNWFLLQ